MVIDWNLKDVSDLKPIVNIWQKVLIIWIFNFLPKQNRYTDWAASIVFMRGSLIFFSKILFTTNGQESSNVHNFSPDNPSTYFKFLKSVHFKNTVARSSVLSKFWSFSIINQLTLFWFQLMYYWNNHALESTEDLKTVFLKWSDYRTKQKLNIFISLL